MKVITTRRDGTVLKPAFSWSYSRLKNFEACPKKHYHVDIAKDATEEKSDQLLWGDMIHKSAADRLGKDKKALIKGTEVLAPWIDRIEKGGGEIHVELKLAIAKDFGACGYFEKGERAAWFRSVADVLKIKETGTGQAVALALDWKTGKIIEDSVQLALMAQCIFSHYPAVQKLRTEFVWLKDDATSRCDFGRDDMPALWRTMLPRVDVLQRAHDNMDYPPKPGGLCKRWCPVQKCPHHGIG